MVQRVVERCLVCLQGVQRRRPVRADGNQRMAARGSVDADLHHPEFHRMQPHGYLLVAAGRLGQGCEHRNNLGRRCRGDRR